MADKYQAVSGAIFMPTSVIWWQASLIRPYHETLDQWERNALPNLPGRYRLAAIIAALRRYRQSGVPDFSSYIPVPTIRF